MSRSQSAKQLLKNTLYASIGAASYFSGISWLRGARRIDKTKLRVLMYHKVNNLAGNTITVKPDLFRRQIAYLKNHYHVISPAELLEIIANRRSLPPRAALITFDDGYRDNMENAYPILKEFGLRALLFVPTDFIGGERPLPHDEKLYVKNPTLTWEELRQIQDVFTIGSHGQSHRVLTRMPFEEAASEISTSKTLIEDWLGQQTDFFSYPKGSLGDFSDQLNAHARETGYTATFGTLPGANALPALHQPTPLRRYNVEPFSEFTFARLLDGSCDLIALKDTSLGLAWKRGLNAALGTTSR